MTIPERPLHLACLRCDERFFSLRTLTDHCFEKHPEPMGVEKCARPGCGHRKTAHVPNKRAYCQAADPKQCPCPNYIAPGVADVA